MQRVIQLFPVLYRPTIQCVLQGTEEPLDSPILPGAMQFNPLVADTHDPEGETKEPGPEHDFVIGTQNLGLTKMFDAVCQCAKEGGSKLILKHIEGEVSSRTVIQYTEDGVQLALVISFAGEIQAPDTILGAGRQFPAPELLANDLDVVVMFADHTADEGLAHGHALRGIAAIENHGNVSASEIRALSLQFDDLLSNPLRFC